MVQKLLILFLSSVIQHVIGIRLLMRPVGSGNKFCTAMFCACHTALHSIYLLQCLWVTVNITFLLLLFLLLEITRCSENRKNSWMLTFITNHEPNSIRIIKSGEVLENDYKRMKQVLPTELGWYNVLFLTWNVCLYCPKRTRIKEEKSERSLEYFKNVYFINENPYRPLQYKGS